MDECQNETITWICTCAGYKTSCLQSFFFGRSRISSTKPTAWRQIQAIFVLYLWRPISKRHNNMLSNHWNRKGFNTWRRTIDRARASLAFQVPKWNLAASKTHFQGIEFWCQTGDWFNIFFISPVNDRVLVWCQRFALVPLAKRNCPVHTCLSLSVRELLVPIGQNWFQGSNTSHANKITNYEYILKRTDFRLTYSRSSSAGAERIPPSTSTRCKESFDCVCSSPRNKALNME